MDHRASPLSDSLEELHRPSCPGSAATHLAKKPPPLRIVVPPSEYCPFSTDLTLPITPLSLPTPVSSSCFTFSDVQELSRRVSAPPTPAPVLSSCSRNTAVADFASPTSSQFLLMPPTPHLEDVESETVICVLPIATVAAANEPMRSESKSENPRPWEVSSSTWLSDLGGHTETDRIFRHNLPDVTLVDTDSSPASTPALSPSAVSPSSQVSSILAYNLPSSLARSPVSLPPALSPCPYTMSPQTSSPARLALKPTGTDTFPSTLDSLQAWRESVTPGIPRSSPLSGDIHDSRLGELIPETVIYPSLPSRQPHSHHPSPRAPRVSKSQTFMKHAKMFGGRVKQLVTRQSVSKHRGSMDRDVSFRVVTSQDSENGSVILITAPPPPYDVGPLTLIPHSPTGQEYVRSRTVSEYSSAVQDSTVELATIGMTESGSRQGGTNRNALRRLSLAALSTIKRF
ncbi:hypothetical protein J3R83DRAFT_6624 [Lanmaoa asiatica]|nr:hypothetical protein J3R83DRAFT_6624 [Lanmaoa asiatica]